MRNSTYKATRRQHAEGMITLLRVRRWFGNEPDAQNGNPTGGAPDGSQHGRIEDLPAWAQTYIKGLRDENADRRRALTAAEDAARQREQAALAEQGQFKTLAEQRAAELEKLKPYQQRTEALEAMIRSGNEARIKQIPEAMRGIVPTDYAPEKLSAWLDANWALLQPKTPPNLDAGAGGSGKPSAPLNDAERQTARRLGLTDEQYAAQKK